MEQYGGQIAPDFRSGRFTSNNVTITVTAPATTTALSKERIAALVQRITRSLHEQAKRYNKRDDGDGGKRAF